MKKVYICSPCRGDYENNIQRAKEFSRAAVERGCIPITPHIYLTQFMDDTVPAERELGLSIGRELVLMCDELWAFGLDCPTAGMAAEIELARERQRPRSGTRIRRTPAASSSGCRLSGRWPAATSTSTTGPSASRWTAASSSTSPSA